MPSPDLLDVRARPRGGQLVVIAVVASAAGAAGTWMTRALDVGFQPSWPLAVTVGACLALGVVVFAMQGARIVIDAQRVLTYSLHGRANLAFDLAAISAARPLHAGLVRGIGIELSDIRQVRFLHKAGISPERMRRWREQHGVDLVLEGFPPVCADQLLALARGGGSAITPA